jgi:gliding motility-associated-like protein
VTRAASSNANLADLAISSGTLSPSFAGGSISYTASVGNAVTDIMVTPTTSDATATVTVNGTITPSGSASTNIPLTVGSNTITTIVTAQDGTTTKTYTIIVTRNSGTGNANLANLKLSSGTLSPNFSSGVISYAAIVTNTTTSVTVTPTASDPAATITVNGAVTASGSASAGIPLSVGANTISVVVTAQGGAPTQTYTVIVTRRPSDYAFLANLQTSSGTLSPAFVSTTLSYAVRAGRTIRSITVTPTALYAFETIKVDGVPAISGATSPAIALNDGLNYIAIVVTAQNGTNTRTYTLAVTKESGALNSFYQSVNASDTSSSEQLAIDGIKIHQGVSPNGDGINDILYIDGIDAYPENKLLIMNRNGELVFETQGYDNMIKVFDGHSNQNGTMQLPGTYYYSLEYNVGNEKRRNTGFLVLKY